MSRSIRIEFPHLPKFDVGSGGSYEIVIKIQKETIGDIFAYVIGDRQFDNHPEIESIQASTDITEGLIRLGFLSSSLDYIRDQIEIEVRQGDIVPMTDQLKQQLDFILVEHYSVPNKQ